MAEKENILKGEDALALARLGKDAWNAWAESSEGCRLDFTGVDIQLDDKEGLSFAGFKFPGHTDFNHAVFHGSADFEGATFDGRVAFDSATFKGRANFGYATFKGGAFFGDAVFGRLTEFYCAKFGEDACFDGTTFVGSSDFSDAKFGGTAEFDGAIFIGSVEFNRATFDGDTDFSDAKFVETASFHSGKFKNACFSKSEFLGETDFATSVFGSALQLDRTIFRKVPDFQSTKTDHHVSMDSIEVAFEGKALFKFWEQAVRDTDAPKYRRLKEMALLAQDHRQEQEFFALELKSVRGSRTAGAALIPGLLYETLSNFGRSLVRPLFGVFSVWVTFAIINVAASYNRFEIAPSVSRLVGAALTYSGAQIFPFVSGTGDARSWAANLLYDRGVPGFVHGLNILEGLLAFMFLFLIGLALRNRFRI